MCVGDEKFRQIFCYRLQQQKVCGFATSTIVITVVFLGARGRGYTSTVNVT
jgi:hypothetical protein